MVNGRYFLKNNQDFVEIDSYGYDLSNFVGKKVEVEGQYSGDTLFVGEIREE